MAWGEQKKINDMGLAVGALLYNAGLTVPTLPDPLGASQPAPPTVAEQLGELRVAITGQQTPPPASGWGMSNYRSATRLNALEPRVDLLEQLTQQLLTGAAVTDAAVQGTVARLELVRAAGATMELRVAADEVRLAAVEAKANLTASATEANRLEISKNTADDALRDARLSQDEAAIATAQATANQAKADAAAAQKKADEDAAGLLALQTQLTQARADVAANTASLATLAADVATKLPAAAVQRFTVAVPAVTIQVLTTYTQTVALPKAFPSANYLVFLQKASNGLLNTELGDSAKTVSTFLLSARNTGAISLAMPPGVVEVLAILL